MLSACADFYCKQDNKTGETLPPWGQSEYYINTPNFTAMVVFPSGFQISIFFSEKLYILALDWNQLSNQYESYLGSIY